MPGNIIEFDAAYVLGEKLIEMADRLKTANKVVPGTNASWGFNLDGTFFEVAIKIGQPQGE